MGSGGVAVPVPADKIDNNVFVIVVLNLQVPLSPKPPPHGALHKPLLDTPGQGEHTVGSQECGGVVVK